MFMISGTCVTCANLASTKIVVFFVVVIVDAVPSLPVLFPPKRCVLHLLIATSNTNSKANPQLDRPFNLKVYSVWLFFCMTDAKTSSWLVN